MSAGEGAYTLLPVIDQDEIVDVAGLPPPVTRVASTGSAAAKCSPECETEKTWRQVGAAILVGHYYQASIALMILANALIIGLETDIQSFKHWDVLELMFLIVFTAELSAKLAVYGLVEYFNRSSVDFVWNAFDFMIVSVGIIDVMVSAFVGKSAGGMATLFRIIRLLRILRIIRIVKFLKQLYLLAFGLAEAAQAVFWVTILMTFVLYTCSIIMVKTVGRPHPDDPHRHFLEEHFGTVLSSMLTLFVLMSSPNMPVYQDEEGLLASRPFLTIFLICFIIFGSFGMIALLTGVISESMFEKNDLRKEEARLELESMRQSMEERCEELFGQVSNDEDEASQEAVLTLLPDMVRMFEAAGSDFTKEDLIALVNYMDVDSSGTISKQEFVRGMLQLAEGLRPITFQQIHYDVGACHVKLEALEEAFAKMFSQNSEVKDLVRHLVEKGVASSSLRDATRPHGRAHGHYGEASASLSPSRRVPSIDSSPGRNRGPHIDHSMSARGFSTPVSARVLSPTSVQSPPSQEGPHLMAPAPPTPPSPAPSGVQVYAQQLQQLQHHMNRLHEELDSTKVAILQRLTQLQEEPRVRNRGTAHFGLVPPAMVPSPDRLVASGNNSPARKGKRETHDWTPLGRPERGEVAAKAPGYVHAPGHGVGIGGGVMQGVRTGPEVAGREGAAQPAAAAGIDDDGAHVMFTFDPSGQSPLLRDGARRPSSFSWGDPASPASLHGAWTKLAKAGVADEGAPGAATTGLSQPEDAATSMEEINSSLASLMTQVRDLAFKHSTICESLADGRKKKSREIWSSRAEEEVSDRPFAGHIVLPETAAEKMEPEATAPEKLAAEKAEGEQSISSPAQEKMAATSSEPPGEE